MLPFSSDRPFATLEDQRRCRAAIITGSKTFYAASKLLPNSVRKPAYGLYAFCRLSDDAIDLDGGSLQALNRLYFRLERAHRGRPLPNPADRAMADLLSAHAVPVAIPEALLEGLGWDAEGRRYETIGDLHAYAARVASTVGVMMTLLMDVRSPRALARACDLGAAMQLTNIARDVGEDARNGRIYLPLRWMDEAEIDVAAFLADPQPTPALRLVVARLLEEAGRLYAQARAGIAELPRNCRPAILAASKIYADIGREVAAAGFDSVTRRAHTSGRRKLQLLAELLIEAPRLSAASDAPVLPECAFLVEAVTTHRRRPVSTPQGFAAFTAPFVRTLAMFERLERAEMYD